MIHLSVKIPDYLHQQLEAKIHEMELPSISDVVRVLLSTALEKVETNNAQNGHIQYKILQNTVACYYLLKEQMVHTEEGLERDHTAHERTKTAMAKILGQTSEAKN
jgi:Arc/MetJ-type ribon-helix-helix transcriptional regulator